MKKLTYVLFIILCSAMLFGCDSKKSDNGGGVKNTPIVEGNYSTYLGNYKATSIQRVVSGSVPAYNTGDAKQILDHEGFLSINMASAAGIDIVGAIQVGGSLFVKNGENNVPAVDSVKDFATTNASVSNITEQRITFQTLADVAGSQYIITMEKTDDTVLNQEQNQAKLWKEKGLCFQPTGSSFENCVTGAGEGQSGTDIAQVNQASSALQLIGNYYLDNITIVEGKTTGCADGSTINIQNNNLVGELSAAAGLNGTNAQGQLLVKLDIVLKYQFDNAPSGCNFPSYHYQNITDNIPVDTDPSKIDFGKVFTDEGLNIIGTQTITYDPQQRNSAGTLVSLDINGVKVKFIFKQARTGVLTQGFAKALNDARYY